jgi:hypothetical protein
MQSDRFMKALLLVIAGLLAVIAFRPLAAPRAVKAQAEDIHPLYFEPGVYMLRAPDNSQQVWGKVAVDMRTGKVWGFPTLQQQSPYPIDVTSPKPPTSHPFYLGRFALGETDK